MGFDALVVVVVDVIMHARRERNNAVGPFEMEVLGFQRTLLIAALSKQLAVRFTPQLQAMENGADGCVNSRVLLPDGGESWGKAPAPVIAKRLGIVEFKLSEVHFGAQVGPGTSPGLHGGWLRRPWSVQDRSCYRR